MPSKDNRVAFSVYLDTGAVIDFRAKKLTHETERATGRLLALEYEDAVGNVPRYIDPTRIVAITRAEPDA